MNKNKITTAGYSLLEVLFVVAIFSVIGLAVVKISNFSWQSYDYNQEHSILQKNRTAVQKIISQTRNADHIKISDSGQQMILTNLRPNSQNKYYHYLLSNNNLYFQSANKPRFIQGLEQLNTKAKLIIGDNIISNHKLFTWTPNKLVHFNFKFKKNINHNEQNKIKLKQNINQKIYPRSRNINANLKSQSEVQQ